MRTIREKEGWVHEESTRRFLGGGKKGNRGRKPPEGIEARASALQKKPPSDAKRTLGGERLFCDRLGENRSAKKGGGLSKRKLVFRKGGETDLFGNK